VAGIAALPANLVRPALSGQGPRGLVQVLAMPRRTGFRRPADAAGFCPPSRVVACEGGKGGVVSCCFFSSVLSAT